MVEAELALFAYCKVVPVVVRVDVFAVPPRVNLLPKVPLKVPPIVGLKTIPDGIVKR